MIKKKWWAVALAVIAVIGCVIVFVLMGSPKEEPDSIEDNVQSTAAEQADDSETATYIVTFYSNDGTVLKIDSVKENASATPPNAPAMTYGTIFCSWDTDFAKVTKDLEIYPIYEEIKEKPNVIAVPGRYSTENGTVVVPVQLCGDVCISGLDMTVRYDADLLALQSITEDGSVVMNDAIPGMIKLNYVSAENTVGDVDLCYLQFYVNATEGEIPITIELNGIYAFKDEDKTDVLYVPESTVIDGKVFCSELREG